jgi:hypothetical protein
MASMVRVLYSSIRTIELIQTALRFITPHLPSIAFVARHVRVGKFDASRDAKFVLLLQCACSVTTRTYQVQYRKASKACAGPALVVH